MQIILPKVELAISNNRISQSMCKYSHSPFIFCGTKYLCDGVTSLFVRFYVCIYMHIANYTLTTALYSKYGFNIKYANVCS